MKNYNELTQVEKDWRRLYRKTRNAKISIFLTYYCSVNIVLIFLLFFTETSDVDTKDGYRFMGLLSHSFFYYMLLLLGLLSVIRITANLLRIQKENIKKCKDTQPENWKEILSAIYIEEPIDWSNLKLKTKTALFNFIQSFKKGALHISEGEDHYGVLIADTIKKVRGFQNKTQEHLAHEAGISVRTLRRAEKDGSVSAENLRCIFATLNIPLPTKSYRVEETTPRNSTTEWGHIFYLIIQSFNIWSREKSKIATYISGLVAFTSIIIILSYSLILLEGRFSETGVTAKPLIALLFLFYIGMSWDAIRFILNYANGKNQLKKNNTQLHIMCFAYFMGLCIVGFIAFATNLNVNIFNDKAKMSVLMITIDGNLQKLHKDKFELEKSRAFVLGPIQCLIDGKALGDCPLWTKDEEAFKIHYRENQLLLESLKATTLSSRKVN